MLKSNFHLIYDTKVFQNLYSTYYKLNGGPWFFIFLLSQVFNLLSCVYIKILSFLNYILGATFFLFTLPCFHLGVIRMQLDLIRSCDKNTFVFTNHMYLAYSSTRISI
jgi:hypothetical protein